MLPSSLLIVFVSLLYAFILFDWPLFLGYTKTDKYKQDDALYIEANNVASGHRYNRYRHPSEAEHRTAEQYNWRNQNYLSMATTLFAGAAALFAATTYLQTKRQADIAQDGLDASDRPWVTLESMQLIGPLSFNDAGDAALTIRPVFVNTGKSPASYVFDSTIFTIGINIEKSLKNQKRGCVSAQKNNEGGMLLAPNRVGSGNVVHEKVIMHSDIMSIGIEHVIIPAIIGCIRYKHGSNYYYSGYAFLLMGNPTDKAGVTKELVLGRTTPADQLSLIQLPVGFFAE